MSCQARADFSMRRILLVPFGSLVVLAFLWLGPARAQDAARSGSPRIALVIGLGAYRTAPLPAAPNDAGLVAQTLAAAGFDVTGARDLDGEQLRQAFREFLDKAAAGGPRGIAMVYLAGHALQYEGDNYLVPVDAHLARDADIPLEAVKISDFSRALAATNLGAKVVVIDGAHADNASLQRLGGGLALADPDPGSLLAFNAAPGSVAPIDAGPYGVYARTLVQMIKQGGVPVDEVFARVRVSLNTQSRGTLVPWDASRLVSSFAFFDRAADAPAITSAQIPFDSLRGRPLRDFAPDEAYDIAIARDSLPAYEDYLAAFPDNPLARRVAVLAAARREAQFWRDALRANSPPAFWTYLRRYPRGPHGSEAQRRLTRLAADNAPPPDFVPLVFDVAPPPDAELAIVERGFRLQDPEAAPPPRPPVFLLPPGSAAESIVPPPGIGSATGLLPIPLAAAIPFVRPILSPGVIRPPRQIRGAYPESRPVGVVPESGRPVPPAVQARPDASPPGPVLPREPDVPRQPVRPAGPVLPKLPEGEPQKPAGRDRPAPPAIVKAPPPDAGSGAPPAGSGKPHPIRPNLRPDPGADPIGDLVQPPGRRQPEVGQPAMRGGAPAQPSRPIVAPRPTPDLRPERPPVRLPAEPAIPRPEPLRNLAPPSAEPRPPQLRNRPGDCGGPARPPCR